MMVFVAMNEWWENKRHVTNKAEQKHNRYGYVWYNRYVCLYMHFNDIILNPTD